MHNSWNLLFVVHAADEHQGYRPHTPKTTSF